MCMEDVKLGREMQSSITYVQVSTNSIQLVPGDDKRTSLIFSSKPSFSAVSEVTICVDPPAVADNGLMLSGYNHPIMLNLKDHGDLVTKAWYGISSLGTVPVAVAWSRLARKE